MASSRAVSSSSATTTSADTLTYGLSRTVGGLERRPVALHRLQHGGRADVVVRREPQPAAARDLGALPAAAAQDPHLQRRRPRRARRAPRRRPPSGRCPRAAPGCRRSARRSPATRRSAAGAGCAGRRRAVSREGARRRSGAECSSPFGVRPSTTGVAVSGGTAGRPAGGRRSGPRPRSKRPGVQRVDQAELLDRGQGGAVAELHGTGAEPDGGGRGGGQREDDGGRGAGHARIEVVLGEPVAGVPEASRPAGPGRWSCAGRRRRWSRRRSGRGRGRRGGCRTWRGSSAGRRAGRRRAGARTAPGERRVGNLAAQHGGDGGLEQLERVPVLARRSAPASACRCSTLCPNCSW